MARYPQGATVRLSFTVKDSTGTLVDGSPVSLVVRKPDGTATTGSPYTPTHDGTGLYSQNMPLADIATLGHYPYVLTATISGNAGVQVGSFDVFDPFEVTVLSLQDAKDTLNIGQTNTSNDDEIRRKIATIEASLERTTGGPIITRSITERVDMDLSPWEIKLSKRPLIAVTTITDVVNSAAVDVSALDLDPDSSMVRRKDGQQFTTTNGVVSVAYTAGWGTTIPAAIAEAAAIILQHLWETQRGGATTVPGFGGDETVTLPGFGYAIPNRAAELLAPYAKAGAVA